MERKMSEHGGTEQGEMGDFFSSWMKYATEFWQFLGKWQPQGFQFPSEQAENTVFHQYRQSWDSGSKIFQAMSLIFSDPDNLNALFRSRSNLPEIAMTIARQVWEGYCDVQKQWAERAVKLGDRAKGYNFEEFDKKAFRAFREIYEKEFQKYLYIPQVGLNRFYQERFNRAVDKFHLFQSTLGEFIYQFYIPLEKSLREMRQYIEKQVEQGTVREDYKHYYNTWIKNLEGHYMQLLQSPEYLEVLDNVITALYDYRGAREELLYDLLKHLPIPTHKEMDEIYKEIYLIKKQLKALSETLETEA
jgi:class III poly(R)-hydroxyalkanoic acid synthase PhaE subunit